MQKTLVWEIIAGLSVPEKREAGLFLASPFFNRREDVRHIFRLLAGAAKKGKQAPSRQAVFGQVFPSVKYSDQKMRLSVSYLFKLLEQFLVQKEMQADPLRQPHLLLSAYRRRSLPRHFQTSLKQVEKRMAKQPLRHPGFHFGKYLVEQERYRFLSGSGRTQALNLQSVENELTAATVAMKLRQACLMRSHEAVFNTQYEVALLHEVLAEAKKAEMEKVPAVKLYLSCFRALFSEEKNDGNFLKFKSLLFESVHLFPKSEMRDLYLLAINYCIKKINENAHMYYREAHDLYRSGLETELLVEDGKLSRFTYNNVVGLSIRIPDVWEWVEWFVEAYRDHLEPEHRESYFSLSSARLEFARKNYDRALLHLQRADYRDLINNLVAKTLQMKIYFEMEEHGLLESHLRTMRMFIRRKKKLGYHRENWSNIVRYTRKLMELNPFDEEARQVLRSEIKAEEILTEKEWLLEKAL